MEADMKIGLHIADFTYPDGPSGLRDDLSRIVTTAEEAGFGRVSVMDHLWQIGFLGPPEHEMLEAYTTLGYLAARTSEVELVSWVTAVVYREPGMLAKLVSTLDVMSGGRAWLGIGAAWNEAEARGLGLPFPADRRAVRAAGGNAADLPADVERGRRSLRGAALSAGADAQPPAIAAATAPADPDRWERGEEDAPSGREVRPGLQPFRDAGGRAQARSAARALRT